MITHQYPAGECKFLSELQNISRLNQTFHNEHYMHIVAYKQTSNYGLTICMLLFWFLAENVSSSLLAFLLANAASHRLVFHTRTPSVLAAHRNCMELHAVPPNSASKQEYLPLQWNCVPAKEKWHPYVHFRTGAFSTSLPHVLCGFSIHCRNPLILDSELLVYRGHKPEAPPTYSILFS